MLNELRLPWHDKDISEQFNLAHDFFIYEPTTGILTRKKKSGIRGKPGQIAGWSDSLGYRRVRFLGSAIGVHRLVWLMCYGGWPSGDIDHINGLTYDNRIVNLRDVTRSVNTENQRKARSDSKLGIQGVRFKGKSFQARIYVNGNSIHLGSFTTEDEAYMAYLHAKREFHLGCTI